jgi:hypothetical protein
VGQPLSSRVVVLVQRICVIDFLCLANRDLYPFAQCEFAATPEVVYRTVVRVIDRKAHLKTGDATNTLECVGRRAAAGMRSGT